MLHHIGKHPLLKACLFDFRPVLRKVKDGAAYHYDDLVSQRNLDLCLAILFHYW